MIKITNFNGFIIRKKALSDKSLNIVDITHLMESDPIDQDKELISYGPSFGEEAARTLANRLENIGLVYVDDYFIFQGDFPEWVVFKANHS